MSNASDHRRGATCNSLAYQVAGALILGMSKTGTLPEDIDDRLDWPAGVTMAVLARLLRRQDGKLREIADICFAIGHYPRFSLEEIAPEILLAEAASPATPSPQEDAPHG